MSSEWKTFVLRDVASIIGGGTPSTKEATYWDGNIPWLTPKDLSSHTGMYVKRGERSITKAGLDGSSAKIVPPGTVLFTSRAPIGYLAIAEQAISTNQGFKSLVLNTEQDNRFFYYLLRFHTPDIEAIATGSTFKEISGSALGSFEVTIPSYGEQTKIADILTTLDDRIELLRETNATLEAIAQALFKSWFVDFDPVRAKQEGREPEGMDADTAALFPDSFEESELGLIPKGWRCSTLADAYEINPSRKLRKGETAPYLEMAGVPTSGHSVDNIVLREMGSGSKFINGDTLLARITPCLENGKSAFVDFLEKDQIGWGSTEFVVLRPRAPLPQYHGYLLCRHPSFRSFAIQSMSGTSGRQRIQNDVIGGYSLVLPSEEVAKTFTEIVEPIQKSIASNHKQSQTLATLRDTLLPRLISGQLRIPEAETLIEETTV